MDAELKDFRGLPLAEGDEVALDVMSYKSSHLRVGKIKEVVTTPQGFVVKVTYPVSGSVRTVSRRPSYVAKVAPVGV